MSVTGTSPDLAASVPILQPSDAPALVARRRRRRFSKKTYLGLFILAFFGILAIIGPTVAPHDPSATIAKPYLHPSRLYPMGTTQLGQDVWSELLIGTRTTLVVGFVAGAIATVLSIIVGVTAGYLGGIWDEALSLLANLFLVVPALPLLIVATKYLAGSSGKTGTGSAPVAIVISLTGWAWGARVLRAQTLTLRKRDFIEASKIVGERPFRVILTEILPNELAVVASSFLFTVLFAIGTQVALAFLGLLDTNIWSWGIILFWAQSAEALNIHAWWWFLWPGLAIALVGTGLALVNFGLDEFTNPRLRDAGVILRKDAKLVRQGYTPVVRKDRPTPATTARMAPARAALTTAKATARVNSAPDHVRFSPQDPG